MQTEKNSEINESNWHEMFIDVLLELTKIQTVMLANLKLRGVDYLTLGDMLNPDCAQITILYRRMICTLKFCRPKELAPVELTDWHSSMMRMLDFLVREYPELNTLNRCRSTQVSLYTLLQTDLPMGEESFQTKIKGYLEEIKQDLRSASDQAIAFGAEEKRRQKGRERKKRGRGKSWKRDDAVLTKNREDSRSVLLAMVRRYRKAQESGHPRSWQAIARDLSRQEEYSRRMGFKRLSTWANQASAFSRAT